MALSAFERKILNKIPAERKNPIIVKYVMAIARQLRSSTRTKFSDTEITRQILSTMDLVRDGSKNVLVVRNPDEKRYVVFINMLDQPFIVDTCRIHLRSLGATNIIGFNAILGLKRNENGEIISVDEPQNQLESVIRFDVDGDFQISPGEMEEHLQQKLELAHVIVKDFKKMTRALLQIADQFNSEAKATPELRQELQETSDFVTWLLHENFVFMGLEIGEERYGLLREPCKPIWKQDILSWEPKYEGTPVIVQKGSQESPIHRFGLVDEIYLEIPGGSAAAAEIVRIQGLFTYRAVTQTSRHVPVLRQKLSRLIRTDGSKKGAYRYKGICNVFDSLPTEFLFSISDSDLMTLIEHVLEAEQEEDLRIDITTQKRKDAAFILLALPRQHWSEDRIPEIVDLLKSKTQATYVDHGAFVSRYNTILVHFFLTGASELDQGVLDQIRSSLSDLIKPWKVKLRESLLESYGEEKGEHLFHRYGSAFNPTYIKLRPMKEVLSDIEKLEELRNTDHPLVDIFMVEGRGRIYVRVYQSQNLLLSQMLPVIDGFGLQVLDQFADPVFCADGLRQTVDTFRLELLEGFSIEKIMERAELLARGLEAVFAKKMGTDGLNYLVLHAGVSWSAVDLFRAIHGYSRQLGLPYPLPRVQGLLLSNASALQVVWRFFEAKFDPDIDDREAAIAVARENVDALIRSISNQAQDLVFRTFYNIIDSILRTNFYRQDRLFHYISFKIDCAKVHNMPSPRMMVEVYVHHREMEGIHLRGGKIARGGIRWSDRTDFRREILDLVATQMVKNVIIVPEGAKGGFRMKKQIVDWSARRRKADQLYQVLIRGLLDVTDNQVDGQIVHPPRVVCYDEADPYLVVAADKGTAHLSDTANGLSAEYNFWLGDAFASGGSNGYDHKAVGITARGGWMTTIRHFHELGIDPEKDEFTAVGIGDPAGDVFGNGVVYLAQKTQNTSKMRLVGAFNHKHIFLDPNPNVALAYKERVRLFEVVSGWDAYNQELISEGGGIFSRSAKSIPLSPQVQKMLGVLEEETELSPEVVIRLLLRLNVDLLWNGGIGTYVKAKTETNFDAGDPNNDNLRVNAEELRARIIGEGGNLGFTQNGRIEYAMNGGRMNTDAIDNSGGVDMSDHEVNIKVLLNPLVASGVLSWDERNVLLESMTETVAQDVLHNSNVHGRQLSLDKVRSEVDPLSFSIAIQWVCNRSKATRTFLRLPSDEELQRRQTMAQGLTRPELAVLAAHVKMHIFKELLASDTSIIADFNQRVTKYFPEKIQQKYQAEIDAHLLYPSIGMTMLLNEIIGDAGALLFPLLSDITGAKAIDIANAWLAGLDTIGATDLLEEMSGLGLHAQYHAWTACTKPLFTLLPIWLFAESTPNAQERERTRDVLKALPKLVSASQKDRIKKSIAGLKAKNIPESLAAKIIALDDISFANEIAQLSGDIKTNIVSYYAVGEASLFIPTIRLLENRKALGSWDPAANAILRSRFLYFLQQLLQSIDLGAEATLGIDRAALRLKMNHLNELNAEMENIITETTDISAIVVANSRAQSHIRKVKNKQLKGTGFH